MKKQHEIQNRLPNEAVDTLSTNDSEASFEIIAVPDVEDDYWFAFISILLKDAQVNNAVLQGLRSAKNNTQTRP